MKEQNTSAYFFFFPVDTLGVRDRWQLCLASVNLLYTLFTSEERIRSQIYESAHIMRSFTSHS